MTAFIANVFVFVILTAFLANSSFWRVWSRITFNSTFATGEVYLVHVRFLPSASLNISSASFDV